MLALLGTPGVDVISDLPLAQVAAIGLHGLCLLRSVPARGTEEQESRVGKGRHGPQLILDSNRLSSMAVMSTNANSAMAKSALFISCRQLIVPLLLALNPQRLWDELGVESRYT